MPASTTNYRASVARHANRLRETARQARSHVDARDRRTPVQNDYAREVSKAVLSSDKSRALEHVCALVVDLAQRGTLEDAEQIGQALVAIARVEYAAAHHERPIVLSRAEAHIAEERAQGERENAEMAMAHFPTLGNMLGFLAADAAYERAARQLREAVRAEVARA